MKKNIFTLSTLAVAALALFSCAKVETEIETPKESKGVPFEIVAGSLETKTTNTNKTISWVENDAITLFHAENGLTDYGSNDRFSITSANLASNKFTGTLADGALDPAKSYDWYAFYPYESHITTPANTDAGYRAIGSANKSTAQVQTGNNNMGHLSGQYFPLYGKVENVDADVTPSISLKPALAIVKVHVVNAEAAPLTVTSISLTSTEEIVGQFFIGFDGAAPVFTARENNTSKTAQLTVTSGSAITTTNAADFYIAVKPFTAANGSKLTIAVNGFSKSVTLTSDFTFPAGKITNLNFNYDLPEYDVLSYSALGISGSGYQAWEDIAGTYSGAVYAGQSNANSDNYVQIRATSPSGIITTTSGGYLNKVVVDWGAATGSGRILSIYGKNAPYTGTAELYDENTRGTLIGTIVNGTSIQLVASNYFAYIGIASNGAAFLNEIDVYWGAAKTKVSAPTGLSAEVSGTTINVSWTDVASNVGSYIVTCSGQEPKVIAQGVHSASFTGLSNDTYTITVQAVPSDVTLATGTYSYSDVVSTTATVTEAVTEVWKATSLASIKTTDVFVIVGTKDSGTSYFVMPNNNGTSAPTATSIEISGDNVSSTVLDTWKWNLTGSAGSGYTFYPDGINTKWLYFTDDNKGVKVGTGAAKAFTFADNKLQYTFDKGNADPSDDVTRILSIYNTQDWRCYTAGASNAVLTFYVLQP